NGTSYPETTQKVVVAENAYYQVQVKDSECWSVLSDSFEFKSLGIDVLANNSLNIYPNPANDFIKITMRIDLGHFNSIDLFDLQGKVVLSIPISASEIYNGKVIDISFLPIGMYMVSLSTRESIITGKLLKY